MPNIEKLAVNAVSDIIGRCQRLADHIDTNDKTPVTDGHIDLYSSDKQSNTTLLGRVPVQVKGRATDKKIKTNKPTASFSVEREVLQFLRNDGGGIYFYVPMRRDGTKRSVFYAILNPFKIDRIVGGKDPAQKTFSITLIKLPEDPAKVEAAVGLALEGRKQGKTQGSVDALLGDLKSITIHSTEGLKLDRPTVFNLEHNDYAVMIETVSGLTLPMDLDLTIYPGSYMPREVEAKVSCGAVEYSRPIVRQTDPGVSSIQLSEGLVLRVNHGEDGLLKMAVDLNLGGSFRQQLMDLTFFLSAASGEPIVIDGASHAASEGLLARKKQLEAVRGRLERLVELFDYLEIDDDQVGDTDFSDQDKRALLELHRAFVRSEEVKATADGVGRYDFTVGPFKVIGLVTPGSDEAHKRIADPFDPTNRQSFRIYRTTEDSVIEELESATVYEGMLDADLSTVLNLRLGSIVPAYEALGDRKKACALANRTTLSLVRVADSVNGPRRDHLLTAAAALSEWSVTTDEDPLVARINRWQILSRQGALSAAERREIRAARRFVQGSDSVDARHREACMLILLGDEEELDLVLESFSADDLATLESWPIWSLRPQPAGDQLPGNGTRIRRTRQHDHG